MLTKIKIELGNIVNYDCDAIVNSANIWLLGGSGVCGAIFRAAGKIELQAECDKIGGCKTGKAVITSGYNLKSKYIIHAVGPKYKDDSDAVLLESTYNSILELADEYKLKSIAIPSISTGVYGYPIEKAVKIALNTLINNDVKSLEVVYIVCFDRSTYDTYQEELSLINKDKRRVNSER